MANDAIRTWQTAHGTVIAYRNAVGAHRQRVVISAPTVVHVRHGTKALTLPDGVLTVEAGAVLLLPQGVHVMSELLDGDAPFESTVIAFTEAFLRAFVARYLPPGALGAASGSPRLQVIDPGPYLAAALRDLPQQLAQAPDPRLAGLKVEELLLAMRQSDAAAFWDRALCEAMTDQDTRFRALIEAHSTLAVSLTEMAGLTGRSLSAFKRDFARLYATSPARWLLQRRLEHAATLLSAGACNVTEAGVRSGFADSTGFIRAFKRHFECTPKQYQLDRLAAR